MTYKGIRIETVSEGADRTTSRCMAIVGSETYRGTLAEVKEQIDAALRRKTRLEMLDSVEQWR